VRVQFFNALGWRERLWLPACTDEESLPDFRRSGFSEGCLFRDAGEDGSCTLVVGETASCYCEVCYAVVKSRLIA
jgi:hypothetical protein